MARREYTFTDEEIARIQTAVLDGRTEDEIAKSFGMNLGDFKYNIKKNKDWKQKYDNAIASVLADCSNNLKRLADGLTVIEKEYLSYPNDHERLKENKKDLIHFLQIEDWDGFYMALVSCVTEESALSVKVKEKQLPPDKTANTLILQAHNQDTWDTEAKRKKIPTTHIHVTTSDSKVLGVGRPIEADYVVEDAKVKELNGKK